MDSFLHSFLVAVGLSALYYLGRICFRAIQFTHGDPTKPFVEPTTFKPAFQSVVIVLALAAVSLFMFGAIPNPDLEPIVAYVTSAAIAMLIAPAFTKGYVSEEPTAVGRMLDEWRMAMGGKVIYFVITIPAFIVGLFVETGMFFLIPMIIAVWIMVAKFWLALSVINASDPPCEDGSISAIQKAVINNQVRGIACTIIGCLVAGFLNYILIAENLDASKFEMIVLSFLFGTLPSLLPS